MIPVPTPADVGRAVTYRDPAAWKIEEGVISSLAPPDGLGLVFSVFVRYGDNPTAQLTPIARLTWSVRKPGQTSVSITVRHDWSPTIDWCEPPIDPMLVRSARTDLPSPDPRRPWFAVVDVWPPYGKHLETHREGEDGVNLCVAVFTWVDVESGDPDTIEWCEAAFDGRTTVTHGSFAAPTHWRLPA